jgi:error-prone DNA polymerase
MVISSRPLVELVPVQPAAMAGRQMCQWDKDSCSDAGFLKIDLLGLGMLSAVEECVDLVARHRGEKLDLSRVPLDDQDVFAEIQRADTIGCFQIESRAQMQTILRTRPENLDDITIQVALVRPGPIQGKAVHPYIERRQKLREDPAYEPPADHPLLKEPLRETLGVVVFQDQVLDVAIHLAGFSVGEAEGLRRAMSRKRSHAALEAYRERFVAGALGNGVDEETAHFVYDKLVAFSGFGFPKSHSAAFGLLAYQSAWLRHHYAPEFLAALLNAQPMGFYPPATLVRDGQRRGVETRPPDVNLSDVGCTIEDGTGVGSTEPAESGGAGFAGARARAVRVGLKYVTGVGEDDAEVVVAARPYSSIRDLAQRAALRDDELRALAESGACDCFGIPRRELLWQLGLVPRPATVSGSGGDVKQLALPLDPTVATPELPEPTIWERMLADYRTTSLSVGVHPLELLRPHLPVGTLSTLELLEQPDRAQVQIAGLVVARQRPATANGVVFMLLEDEHAPVNLIVPPQVYERYRAVVRGEPLLLVRGRYEHSDRNRNVLVRELASLGGLARELTEGADVHASLPRAHHFGHR